MGVQQVERFGNQRLGSNYSLTALLAITGHTQPRP
jgi:hypothetical protein